MIKKTTLEEAAEKYAEIYRCPATNDNEYCKHDIISAINFGATWRQKQLTLSDEEIDKIAKEHILYNDSKRQWFIEGMKIYREQFKKKQQ